ncbi:MAG: Mur ligase [Deltaproteobacteria bacterium]|nr:Mur ligase [Deltaproteobacteria bacterium]
MRFENARRITGRSLLMPGPGAAVEHLYDPGDDAAALTRRFDDALVGPALDALGLAGLARFRRDFAGGASVGIEAPIDRLYAEVDLLEWASEALAGSATLTFDEALARFREQAAAEANPALVALQAEARRRGLPFTWDDEHATIGWGRGARTWAAREIPPLEAIDWTGVGRIPVALVTGTNGKTTTTRMTTRILKAAGHVVGATSTDAITVDEAIVEAGDWTGPGAARAALRRPEVTAAVLETARGGILRRGLAVEAVDAALVTNVAEDHFGDWGIGSLEAMAAAKGVVWDAVRPGGARLVDVDDPVLAAVVSARVAAEPTRWVLVSREYDNIHVVSHRAAGGRAWVVKHGVITRADGAAEVSVVAVADIPATFGGHARHNVDNALCAAAVAAALGADDRAIVKGLSSFGRTPDDNPGRLELHAVRGVRVLLDFSHNPHGVRAVRPIVEHLVAAAPGARLSICVGQAGDRSDHDLAELAREVLACRPAAIWLRPLPGYERGRAPGETAAILSRLFVAGGLPEAAVTIVEGEVEALRRGLAWARPGDLLVHFVHIERADVRALIAELR